MPLSECDTFLERLKQEGIIKLGYDGWTFAGHGYGGEGEEQTHVVLGVKEASE